jgi:hypothetical protein
MPKPSPPRRRRSASASTSTRASPASRPSSAIKLAFVDGYTHEELGERLGVPLGTAKSRVRRSVEQLRAYFETEDTVWATRLPTTGEPAKG